VSDLLPRVHTLLFREHNRLCDILIAQHPDWDDEHIFQTIRLVLGAKMALIGNSYQMAYWYAPLESLPLIVLTLFQVGGYALAPR